MKAFVIAPAIGVALLFTTPSAFAQQWVHCATEGGFCAAPAGAVIHYGRRGAFTHRRSPPGGLPCNNQIFGDPLVGVHKECFFS
ncbi:MAG: hypothetical protein JO000_03150 [Alphaproteobacteria bacterium]|nr:hypothetical protein [Alphaproteobacteria bacterium]